MHPATAIPRFLLPRGLPSAASMRTLLETRGARCRIEAAATTTTTTLTTMSFSACTARTEKPKTQRHTQQRVLEKPDRFRPPSHPARRVVAGRPRDEPVNYPGPRPSQSELDERRRRQYPRMFPPEGTVMYRFLTNRWIHIWIAMGVLTSLATFTFTTNFKRTSPFAHLLPPWSGLLTHPLDTVSQALTVYKMHVQHTSVLTREKRHRRVEDAEKRRQFRVAHGLEQPAASESEAASEPAAVAVAAPAAATATAASPDDNESADAAQSYLDWDGKRRPVKKWLGIW